MVLWLRCYKKSIETMKTYSVDYIKFAKVKKDKGETSNVTINDEKQILDTIIHNLPMIGCTVEEETEKHRFFFLYLKKIGKRVKK